jgi:predicted aspartyl protease
MAAITCGFNSGPAGNGRDLLVGTGPTLFVKIGFDQTYDPATDQMVRLPNLPDPPLPALVDTGATESCIDSVLAMRLNLPIIDRRRVSGVHGAGEVNVHLAHVHIMAMGSTLYGPFCGVELIAGGQLHQALIGRTFLQHFTMVYEGRTGSVTIHND